MDVFQMYRRAEKMVRLSDAIRYKNISIGQALKIAFVDYLSMRSEENNRGQYFRLMVRKIAANVYHILVGWSFHAILNKESTRPGYFADKNIVVVADHSGHMIRMTLDLIKHFDKEQTVLITVSPTVYRHMYRASSGCLFLYHPIRKWRFHLYLVYYRKVVRAIDCEGFLFRLFLFIMVARIVQAVDYYNDFFDLVRMKAVVTMSDRHPNEYVITQVAVQRSIRTYTNQHAWFGFAVLPAYLPVVSDKIFVWGNRSREHLLANDVPDDKIVISGNPRFDHVHARYHARRDKIRSAFIDKHRLNARNSVLTYISPGIAPPYISYDDAFELFKCFCQGADYPFNLVVKIRPAQDSEAFFKEWLSRLNLPESRVLLCSEELYEVFTATDIAVTSMTSAGIEAIGFGLPTIALNIIAGVDLKDFLSYNGDAIECNTPREYRATLEQLSSDPDYFRRELRQAMQTGKKYFQNSEHFCTSEFIRNYIQSELH